LGSLLVHVVGHCDGGVSVDQMLLVWVCSRRIVALWVIVTSLSPSRPRKCTFAVTHALTELPTVLPEPLGKYRYTSTGETTSPLDRVIDRTPPSPEPLNEPRRTSRFVLAGATNPGGAPGPRATTWAGRRRRPPRGRARTGTRRRAPAPFGSGARPARADLEVL